MRSYLNTLSFIDNCDLAALTDRVGGWGEDGEDKFVSGEAGQDEAENSDGEGEEGGEGEQEV